MSHHFRKWLKRRLKWILTAFVVVTLLLTFVPFIPSNAVRLCILENGHPIAAILAGPSKLPQSEVKDYSGNEQWLHYQVNVPFSTESADVDVLVVHKISNQRFYSRYAAEPAYAVGP